MEGCCIVQPKWLATREAWALYGPELLFTPAQTSGFVSFFSLLEQLDWVDLPDGVLRTSDPNEHVCPRLDAMIGNSSFCSNGEHCACLAGIAACFANDSTCAPQIVTPASIEQRVRMMPGSASTPH